MDSESEDLFFQKLQELVLDDDKIVTVPYLARTLKISVQNSKYLIEKYVKDQRKLRPEELGIVYVLTGRLKDGRGKAVLMVKETDLTEKKEKFDEILNEVVFSIQKSKNVDFNVISLVDQFDSTNIRDKPLEGLIVGKNCTKRVLKFKKLPPLPPSTLRGKSSFFAPKSEESKSSEKVTDSSKSVSKHKSANGIAAMFNNAVSKETEKKPVKETKQLPKAKGGLSNFFSKSTTKSSNGTKSENNSDKENGTNSVEFNSEQSIKLEDLTSFMEVDVEESSEDMNKTVVIVDEETPKKIEKEQKKSSKRQRETSAGKSTKKRKRIVQRDDSESDDMFENEPNEEDIIEKSDEDPERVPSPVAEKVLPPKNKRRKAVEKTYEDEEGYIVTKTEYVYETASEDENESPEVAKVEEKVVKPKPLDKKSSASSENDISPQKGTNSKKGKKNSALQNQPTLMNFFKKK